VTNDIAEDEKIREDILRINKKLHGKLMEALLGVTLIERVQTTQK